MSLPANRPPSSRTGAGSRRLVAGSSEFQGAQLLYRQLARITDVHRHSNSRACHVNLSVNGEYPAVS